MDESRSPAEINSIDCFKNKRKLQEELLELPLSKHACRHQNRPIVVFPSDCYNTEPNKEDSDQSDQESANDSNSFHYNNGDSIMSADDEFKTDLEYPEIYEASTSSASWDGTFPAIQFYPSLTKSNPSQTESSLAEQINFYPYYQCGTEPSLNSEEHLEEFGNNGVEEPMDKESAGNYVLSSGRWSVNDQDTDQQERNQVTIDKEFEQYFSMLMM